MPEYSNDQIDQVRELERAVLGGLMLETERYDNVRLVISHADFQGKDHQSIFESMGDLVNAGKPLDPITVADRLDSKNLLTEKKESEVEKKDKEESNEKIPFTEDEYKILINDFSESLKEKKSEVAILKKRNSIEGTEITFHLDNELEGTIFDSIINRLKEKLKNFTSEKLNLKKLLQKEKQVQL